MSRTAAAVLGGALIVVVTAITAIISFDDGSPETNAQREDRFASVADQGNLLGDVVKGLEVSPTEMLEALADGATLAEVIEDNGGDPASVATSAVGLADEAIDEALDSGVIDAGEADELRAFVAETVDGLLNLPIGVLFRDLGLAGGLLRGVPFEAFPDGLPPFDEEGDEFRFGPFEGAPFDLDALPEDLPDEVRERLQQLQEELENLNWDDLGFDGRFDDGEFPDELGELFDGFFDGRDFHFDFDFGSDDEGSKEAA